MNPIVVLLPGNMCDGRLWEGGDGVVLTRLAAAGWRHARPVLDADSIEAMAASVLAAEDGPIIPIGFSMGGIVALEMARQAPERVVALGLIDSNAAADLPERAAVRPDQQARVRRGELEPIVVNELKPNYLAAENRGDSRLLDLLRDMALGIGPDVFVRQSEALRTRPDLVPVLEQFAGPMLVAGGAEDRLCPPSWHRRWAELARSAELHIVEGAGHMLPLEQPRRFADMLTDWLARVKDALPCPTAF